MSEIVCSPLKSGATFRDFKDYLVCRGIITKRITEKEYEYGKYTPRKELLLVAVKTADTISLQTDSETVVEKSSTHFLDVGVV